MKPIKNLFATVTCLAATAAFATQALAGNGHEIDFGIDKGQVIPAEEFAINVIMLGSAITSGGRDMPVTVSVKVHNETFEPFGDSSDAMDGNVNDHSGVRNYIIRRNWDKNIPITVTATSWSQKSKSTGESGGDYTPHQNRNSNGDHPYVKVLRNGDPVPVTAGFENQTSIADYVQEYVNLETNTMVLDENSAIFLFELGVTDLKSAAADFQDVVVLITLGESYQALENGDLMDIMFD